MEEQIPKEFHKYLDVFSEEKAARFPEPKKWDHKIELKDTFVLLETYGWGCRMRGRRTDRSYRIRWREWNTEKGRKCRTYIVGVKDLASAYVLCPRLAECGGLSIYGRNRGLRNNEGIVSGVMTQSRKLIRTEY